MEPAAPDDGAPAAVGSPPAMTLAANLRLLRARANFTLADLAARAGIGKSTLAQLESGKANPSIDTLFSLAVALGVPLGHLFAASTPEVRVVRRKEGIPLDSSNHTFHAELLATSGRHGTVEIMSLEMRHGATRVADPHIRGTVEHILVYEGRLRTGPVDHPVDLDPGDFVSFDADVPHCYEALEKPTRWVGVLDYPS